MRLHWIRDNVLAMLHAARGRKHAGGNVLHRPGAQEADGADLLALRSALDQINIGVALIDRRSAHDAGSHGDCGCVLKR